MGPEITVMKPAQRDSYGQYQILAGHTHVFEFQVPMFGSLNLKIAHLMPNSQDFSLDFWVSDQPLDGLQLERGFGHFRAKRRADQFTIHDSYLRAGEDDERMFLDSHKTYYVNVKNLQNRVNAYELDFSQEGVIPPP